MALCVPGDRPVRQVIDVFVSTRRNATAAHRFFERAVGTTKVRPAEGTVGLAQRCRQRVAEWSRFPSRQLSEVLSTTLASPMAFRPWWRSPVE